MTNIVVGLRDLQQFSARVRMRLENVSRVPARRRLRELDEVGLEALTLSKKVETFLVSADKELDSVPRNLRARVERRALPVAAKLRSEMVNIQTQLIILNAAA